MRRSSGLVLSLLLLGLGACEKAAKVADTTTAVFRSRDSTTTALTAGDSTAVAAAQKPPELDDSAEGLVTSKQFHKAVAKVNLENRTQGFLHCTTGTTHGVNVEVYGVEHGGNLKLASDFASGHGRIVAVVKNTSTSCTTTDIPLPPKATGYWIVRHSTTQSDPESMFVVVNADGTVNPPIRFRARVKECPGTGEGGNRAQIRDWTDRCEHLLDKQMQIRSQRETPQTRPDSLWKKNHDPTLWMACSFTCCYADGDI